jgi:pyruvate/2-oxoacid:ferredoxin oxidoreductase alpha subunit
MRSQQPETAAAGEPGVTRRAHPRLMKGNEAAIYGALLAGCRSYYGYPITPASELAETAAKLFPLCGGTFLQAESEVASINMLYGAASAGERTMTGSSSPGISLMMEGVSYAAGSELPMVIIDIMRGGPGLGNIGPEQSDYFQVVKGGGHGNYNNIVLAPASAQEMADLTMLAFELSDKYRNPAFVIADGFVGQTMEPVSLPMEVMTPRTRPWAVLGDAGTRRNLISSIFLSHDALERHEQALQAKYAAIRAREVRYQEVATEDAEILFVGYGIVSRVLRRAVALLRQEGVRAGLLRPLTLWPFPHTEIRTLAKTVERTLVVELSAGQMVEDVRLAVGDSCPVDFYGRMGGNVPTAEEIVAEVHRLFGGARHHEYVDEWSLAGALGMESLAAGGAAAPGAKPASTVAPAAPAPAPAEPKKAEARTEPEMVGAAVAGAPAPIGRTPSPGKETEGEKGGRHVSAA